MNRDEAFASLNIRRLKQAAIPKYFAVQVTEDNLDLLATAFEGSITHEFEDDPEHPDAKVQVRSGIVLPTSLGNEAMDIGSWLVRTEGPLGPIIVALTDYECGVIFDDDGPLRDPHQLELDLGI